MAIKPIIYNKDKKVKIFYLTTTRDENGFKVTIKKYIHPIDKSLNAYIRDLSQKELQSNMQVQDSSTAIAIINRREINNTMYLEYKRRGMRKQTYNINGVDYFDDSTNDIKLTISLVKQSITFDREEGTEW